MDKKTKEEMRRALPYRYRAKLPIYKFIFYAAMIMIAFVLVLQAATFISLELKEWMKVFK